MMEDQHDAEERPEATGLRNFEKKFKPGVKVLLIISLLVNFVMVVMGAVYFHKCPANPNIPIFLIVTGVIGMVSKFVSYVRERLQTYFQVKYLEIAIYSIEIITLILGAYWVYTEFKPSFVPTDQKNYCNKNVYMFAFTYITVVCTVVIALAVGSACFFLCLYILSRNASTRYDVESQASQVEENRQTLTTRTDA